MQIFSIKYSTVSEFPFCDFLNNIFISLACFILRLWYILYIAYRKCVHQSFRLSVRLPVNSRLGVVKFWGSQKLYMNFSLSGGAGAPHLCVVQWSTVG